MTTDEQTRMLEEAKGLLIEAAALLRSAGRNDLRDRVMVLYDAVDCWLEDERTNP